MKKILTGIFVIITTAASWHLQAQIKPTGGFGGPSLPLVKLAMMLHLLLAAEAE